MPSVLVVDDSPIDRRLAVGVLEKEAGFTVDAVASGTEALSRAAQRTPDIVVTDLQMPDMSGLELVRNIRTRHPLLPVVLMTAHGSEEIALQALHRGAASYVPKAKLAQDLASTVRTVLATSRADRRHSQLMDCLRKTRLDFVLANDPALIYPLVDYLQDQITRIGLCDEMERVRVGIALQEALSNAMFHGNLALSTDLMRRDSGLAATLIERRQRELPFCNRRLYVSARIAPTAGMFIIRDEGEGFDHAAFPANPSQDMKDQAGRGLTLMRAFMDSVTFNEVGNEVTLLKSREEEAK